VRQVLPYSLWLGHVGDARDLRRVLSLGIGAQVDLALNERPVTVTRELVYCRCPLLDGPGNPPWLLRFAVETTAVLIRARTPTLVFCSAGMSRSPAVVAAAIASLSGRPVEKCLAEVTQSAPADVSPGLWQEVVAACR
jgi:protein-tyrosine phosphatase